MKKAKDIRKVLLKDIIIPKGTVLDEASIVTKRISGDYFGCVIGLSKNTCGYFEYCIDSDELNEYFADLIE